MTPSRSPVWLLAASAFVWAHFPWSVAVAEPGDVLPLPKTDRAFLDKMLGDGVVGKAVAAPVITDPTRYFPLRTASREFRMTGGERKGSVEVHTLRESKRSKGGSVWRYEASQRAIAYLRQTKDGSVWIGSFVEHEQGVVSRFSPMEPGVLANMKPGESRRSTVGVKVYDLGEEDDVQHRGSLDVTYTYVGAYEIKVPAGAFEGCLIKWEYKGKVGPAKVEDTQHRFFVDGVGLVATVDAKDISAFLVYRDRSKSGKVLIAADKPR